MAKTVVKSSSLSDDYINSAQAFLADASSEPIRDTCSAALALISAAHFLDRQASDAVQVSIVRKMRAVAKKILTRDPHRVIPQFKKIYKSGRSTHLMKQADAAITDTLLALGIAAETYGSNENLSQALKTELGRYVSQLCYNQASTDYWFKKLAPIYNPEIENRARGRIHALIRDRMKSLMAKHQESKSAP